MGNLFTRCIDAMFIHATAAIPIYQSNYSRMGMTILGLGWITSARKLWICTLDKDGNVVSFFNFIETEKEYWHWYQLMN